MKPRTPGPAAPRTKRDALFRDATHDSYRARRKPVSPTVCPGCKAVFQDGRWQWAPAPAAAHKGMCPACLRIRDDFPAGYVTLKGGFLAKHRDDVMHLVRNTEAREKGEHPLQRIVKLLENSDGLLVTTTDIHLARSIGDALHHAYRGKLDFHYNPEQTLIRVVWER